MTDDVEDLIAALILQIRSETGDAENPRRSLIKIFNDERYDRILSEILHDEDDLMVVDAAYILSELVRPKRFHAEALKVLSHNEPEARYYALSGIDMDDPSARAVVERLQADEDESVRAQATRLLGYDGLP